MPGAGLNIVRRIRAILGPDAPVESGAGGLPRVTPRSEDALALVLQAASAEGWRVRIEGAATWMPADAPADLALSTRGLNTLVHLSPADLVATAQAGMTWDELRRALADQGTWLAADPPGGGGRTLGSVVSTASAGPLRSGFGGIREHLLGLTLVTGHGRITRPGGRVMKNVAGFDLTKLATGSFGGFGVVTSLHLRLRAVPRADVTLLAHGDRDVLVSAAVRTLAAGASPAALELLSPHAAGRDGWTLAVRLTGSDPGVESERHAVSAAMELPAGELAPSDAAKFWRAALSSAVGRPVTLRLGGLPATIDEMLDLLAHHLDSDWVMASVAAGAIRWSGTATADRIKLLRHAASQREVPLTLERGPWGIREQVGHFGAYREGVGPLVSNLRSEFDPAGALVAPLGPDDT